MRVVGVCEDDPAIRALLARAVGIAGHRAVLARTGGEALRLFGADAGLDVVVMDIGLPDADGRDVVAALKSAGQHAPVLFLTALGSVHDRLSGFSAGADDYVCKPFEVKEVLARLEVLGRRATPRAAPPALGLDLDAAAHAVRTASGEVRLTPTEFRMLTAISSRPGEVVRRRVVVASAWPDGAVVSDNTVDSFIRRIRRKLESVRSPTSVETVRGVGYRLT